MSTANEIIPRIWEVLNSFSDEARKSARKKVKELELDPDKGEIPLNESLVNLETAARTLRDAIEKQKLIQLPLTVQKEILAKTEAISGFLAGLNSGSDEIVNFVGAIEQLNTAVWQYGLHNLSGEVLGYQTKMNQLKNEEEQLRKLKEEIEEGLKRKEELFALLDETKTAAEEATAKTQDTLQATTVKNQDAAALVATIEQSETSSTKQAATAKASAAEVQAIEVKIKEFFAEIDEYRKKIESTSTDARSNVDANRAETKELVAKLLELENQIKLQIERATGFSLFHSFQTRQEKVTSAKKFWGVVLGVIDLRQSRRLEFWSRSKRQLFFIDSPENHVLFCSFSSFVALIASHPNLASGHCLIANSISSTGKRWGLRFGRLSTSRFP